MIEPVLPAEAVAADTAGDFPETLLFPAERALIRDAVPERRREFATARVCAHRAQAALGLPVRPVLCGPRGEPRWPAGTVGSVTHCTGYRGAALALAAHCRTLGIDAEPHLPLPPGTAGAVTCPAERRHLRDLAGRRPAIHWDRLLFSAKEAVFKAWSPLTGHTPDFGDARVCFHPAHRTFTAHLRTPGPEHGGRPLEAFTGRWTLTSELLLTAVALPALPAR
ncbi:4'-phosphopantetheinyl transferase family protein [Streptomyces sp. enrichment culture]|uniref:4'-phosphopantetheinyl transferase family protein n=1 Tax=Streptomyces sp. enrichment culture TaxID=1795815 RepID=UPI003F559862